MPNVFSNTTVPQRKGNSDIPSVSRYHQSFPCGSRYLLPVSSEREPDGLNPFAVDILQYTTSSSIISLHEEMHASMNPFSICEEEKKMIQTNPFDETILPNPFEETTIIITSTPPKRITLPVPSSSRVPSPSLSSTKRMQRQYVACWVAFSVFITSLLLLSGVLFYILNMGTPGGAEDAMMQRENGGRLRGAPTTVSSPQEEKTNSTMLAPPPTTILFAEDDVHALPIESSPTVITSGAAHHNDKDEPLHHQSTDTTQWLLGGVDVVALQNALTSSEKIIMGDQERYVVTLENENISAAFVSRKNADLFWLQPERYLPAFGGFSVWALCSLYTFYEIPVDSFEYEIFNQRLLLFSNEKEKVRFSKQREECWDIAKRVYHHNTDGRIKGDTNTVPSDENER